jgi:hypothetical protein
MKGVADLREAGGTLGHLRTEGLVPEEIHRGSRCRA